MAQQTMDFKIPSSTKPNGMAKMWMCARKTLYRQRCGAEKGVTRCE
jgi:hypothetical protein